jgi:hypothetical protein
VLIVAVAESEYCPPQFYLFPFWTPLCNDCDHPFDIDANGCEIKTRASAFTSCRSVLWRTSVFGVEVSFSCSRPTGPADTARNGFSRSLGRAPGGFKRVGSPGLDGATRSRTRPLGVALG